LNYHYSEWIHAPLIGAPYGSGVLYASFKATLTALPGTNDYFAFFDDDANSPRCRVRVGTTNAPAGKFTFGISSSSPQFWFRLLSDSKPRFEYPVSRGLPL
jgi:hypothetical protein